MKKTIVVYSDNASPYRIGWTDALVNLGYDVTYYYLKEKDKERNDKWLVKKSEGTKLKKLASFLLFNRGFSISAVNSMLSNKNSIVIFDGYGVPSNLAGIWLFRLLKRKYCVNIDGFYMNKTDGAVAKKIKRSVFGSPCYPLCSSELTRNRMMEYGAIKEHCVVHNFSSIHQKDILVKVPSDVEKVKLKKILGFSEKPIVLGVGRFLDWKHFDILIQACSLIKNEIQLVIIGEGEEKNKYIQLLKDYDMQDAVILGFMSYDELTYYYRAASIFVLPSDGEVWGLVVNEAMCFGLPVITSDTCVAGQALVVDDKNGYHFRHNDYLDLSEKIKKTLNHTKQFGNESLRIIQDYNIENMAKIHDCFFTKVVSDENTL